MNITEKIQQLRKEKGWTITRLAQETGIPTVSLRVMLSRKDPNGYTIKNLVRIAEALGVTVSYLTLDDGEKEAPTLTLSQREEIKNLIAKTIDDYFALPNNDDNEIAKPAQKQMSITDLED